MGLACSYRLPFAHHQSSVQSTSASPREAPPTDQTTWTTTDMMLLQHYVSCSCLSFSPGTTRHDCWTMQVSKIALHNNYLLHQLLAVAALHMMSTGPSDSSLFESASLHRRLALEGVGPVMTSWAPNSSISLFAFAGLTTIYSYGEVSLRPRTTDEVDVIGRIISCFHLARGISTVLSAHNSEIQRTWAAGMTNFDAADELSLLRSSGLGLKQIDNLSDLIRTHAKAPDVVDAYLDAARRCLENITLLLRNQDAEDDISYLIMSWPNEVHEVYMEQLESRDPVALVILAHYAVLMKMRTRYWWLKGLPLMVLQDVERVIPQDFRYHLEWPSQMIRPV